MKYNKSNQEFEKFQNKFDTFESKHYLAIQDCKEFKKENYEGFEKFLSIFKFFCTTFIVLLVLFCVVTVIFGIAVFIFLNILHINIYGLLGLL